MDHGRLRWAKRSQRKFWSCIDEPEEQRRPKSLTLQKNCDTLFCVWISFNLFIPFILSFALASIALDQIKRVLPFFLSRETTSQKKWVRKKVRIFRIFHVSYMIYYHIAYCVFFFYFHIVFLLFCPDPVLGQVFNISDSRLGFLWSPLISDLLSTNTFLVSLP